MTTLLKFNYSDNLVKFNFVKVLTKLMNHFN
jgi:hypothetical protein